METYQGDATGVSANVGKRLAIASTAPGPGGVVEVTLASATSAINAGDTVQVDGAQDPAANILATVTVVSSTQVLLNGSSTASTGGAYGYLIDYATTPLLSLIQDATDDLEASTINPAPEALANCVPFLLHKVGTYKTFQFTSGSYGSGPPTVPQLPTASTPETYGWVGVLFTMQPAIAANWGTADFALAYNIDSNTNIQNILNQGATPACVNAGDILYVDMSGTWAASMPYSSSHSLVYLTGIGIQYTFPGGAQSPWIYIPGSSFSSPVLTIPVGLTTGFPSSLVAQWTSQMFGIVSVPSQYAGCTYNIAPMTSGSVDGATVLNFNGYLAGTLFARSLHLRGN
jgi:hypothetical protein